MMVVLIVALIMGGGIAMMGMGMTNRRRWREMEHRERLAMIERGILPPPELDPAGFEARASLAPAVETRGAIRARIAGVIMVGFGLALMLLISFVANSPDVGIGIGGAFALVGGAFLFNSMLLSRQSYDSRPPTSTYGRSTPGDSGPRSNVGP